MKTWIVKGQRKNGLSNDFDFCILCSVAGLQYLKSVNSNRNTLFSSAGMMAVIKTKVTAKILNVPNHFNTDTLRANSVMKKITNTAVSRPDNGLV